MNGKTSNSHRHERGTLNARSSRRNNVGRINALSEKAGCRPCPICGDPVLEGEACLWEGEAEAAVLAMAEAENDRRLRWLYGPLGGPLEHIRERGVGGDIDAEAPIVEGSPSGSGSDDNPE